MILRFNFLIIFYKFKYFLTSLFHLFQKSVKIILRKCDSCRYYYQNKEFAVHFLNTKTLWYYREKHKSESKEGSPQYMQMKGIIKSKRLWRLPRWKRTKITSPNRTPKPWQRSFSPRFWKRHAKRNRIEISKFVPTDTRKMLFPFAIL